MTYVYSFAHRHQTPPMSMKDLLGGKGANLAEMTSVLELPVPPGFTITTDACRAYMAGGWPKGLSDEVARQLARLEKAMAKKLGDPSDPLLVSVRSGAKFSMPGMMDTVLNLGLNDRSVKGLARATADERFAHDSYRRFIAMYARQASVEIVKPDGTGSSSTDVISARFAPLPPRRSLSCIGGRLCLWSKA